MVKHVVGIQIEWNYNFIAKQSSVHDEMQPLPKLIAELRGFQRGAAENALEQRSMSTVKGISFSRFQGEVTTWQLGVILLLHIASPTFLLSPIVLLNNAPKSTSNRLKLA